MRLCVTLLVLSLCLFYSAEGTSLIDRCHNLPISCKNFNTAKNCGKIAQCKDDYWSRPGDNDEICTLCKDAVGEIDDYIKNNATKVMIKAALLKLCSSVPISQLSTECTDLINEDYDMFYTEVLLLMGSPDMVCGALGLCSASPSDEKSIESMMQKLPVLLQDGLNNNQLPIAAPIIIDESDDVTVVQQSEVCGDCQALLKDLQRLIASNMGLVDEWKDEMKMECEALGPGPDQVCEEKIDEAIDLMISSVNTEEDTLAICKSIQMCGFKRRKAEGNDVCTDCENFVEDWKYIFQHNKTMVNKIIETVASFYCLQKPADLERQCTRYVSMVISNELNRIAFKTPKEICQAIYFCDAEEGMEVKNNDLPTTDDGKVSDPVSCAVCRLVVHELDKMIEGNRTEAAVVAALDKVCGYLPEEMAEECKTFVNEYGKDLVDLIINEVESGVICSQLLLCSVMKPPVVEAQLQSTAVCEVCTLVARELDYLLMKNSTEQEITKAVEKVCNLLGKYRSDCDNIIENYGPTIIDLLVHGLPADKFCAMIDLCPKVTISDSSNLRSSEFCDVCKLVISFLGQELEANATKKEIEAALEQICLKLPQQWETLCDGFVQQYTPEILDLADHLVDPDFVCVHLGACLNMKKPLVGVHHCTYGPSYWCKNEETAKECHAEEHCRRHVWN